MLRRRNDWWMLSGGQLAELGGADRGGPWELDSHKSPQSQSWGPLQSAGACASLSPIPGQSGGLQL